MSDLCPGCLRRLAGIVAAIGEPAYFNRPAVRADQAATAAQTLKRHRGVLDAIAGIRRQLATFGYGRGTNSDAALFISAASSAEQLTQAETLMQQTDGLGGHSLHLTAGGFTLRLNTAEETRALQNTAHSATSAAQAAARERRNAEHAKTWGLPKPVSAAC